MATKTAAPDDADAPLPPAPSFAWTRDPLVLVSRRIRDIAFPGALLVRDPTPADLARWRDPNSRTSNVAEHKVRVLAGVTFLGAYTSAWALRAVPGPGQAPRSAPAPDSLLIVQPDSRTAAGILSGGQFMDRDSRRVDPAKVHAAWLRVFRWMETEDARTDLPAGDDGLRLRLFSPADGHDAPEMAIMRLSEVLTMTTEAGRHAFPATMNACRWHKDGPNLGALHDYAVRTPASWPLVTEIRARLAKAPGLAPA